MPYGIIRNLGSAIKKKVADIVKMLVGTSWQYFYEGTVTGNSITCSNSGIIASAKIGYAGNYAQYRSIEIDVSNYNTLVINGTKNGNTYIYIRVNDSIYYTINNTVTTINETIDISSVNSLKLALSIAYYSSSNYESNITITSALLK